MNSKGTSISLGFGKIQKKGSNLPKVIQTFLLQIHNINIYNLGSEKGGYHKHTKKSPLPPCRMFRLYQLFLKVRFWCLVVRSSYMCTLNWCDFYMFYLDLSCLIVSMGFEVCFEFISIQFLVKNVFLIFFYQSQKIKTNSVFLSLFKFTTTGT